MTNNIYALILAILVSQSYAFAQTSESLSQESSRNISCSHDMAEVLESVFLHFCNPDEFELAIDSVKQSLDWAEVNTGANNPYVLDCKWILRNIEAKRSFTEDQKREFDEAMQINRDMNRIHIMQSMQIVPDPEALAKAWMMYSKRTAMLNKLYNNDCYLTYSFLSGDITLSLGDLMICEGAYIQEIRNADLKYRAHASMFSRVKLARVLAKQSKRPDEQVKLLQEVATFFKKYPSDSYALNIDANRIELAEAYYQSGEKTKAKPIFESLWEKYADPQKPLRTDFSDENLAGWMISRCFYYDALELLESGEYEDALTKANEAYSGTLHCGHRRAPLSSEVINCLRLKAQIQEKLGDYIGAEWNRRKAQQIRDKIDNAIAKFHEIIKAKAAGPISTNGLTPTVMKKSTKTKSSTSQLIHGTIAVGW